MEHPTQTRKFSTSDVTLCLCANVRRVTRKITQLYDGALRPTGLTSAQFNIIATLKYRPDLSITELSKALGVDRTTLTRNLKPLVRKGLIRSGGMDDDRVRTTSLTDIGMAKFDECYPLWQSAQEQLSERLGTKNIPDLLRQMSAVLSAAEDLAE